MLTYYFKTKENQDGSMVAVLIGHEDVFAKGSNSEELKKNMTEVLVNNFMLRIEFSKLAIPLPAEIPEAPIANEEKYVALTMGLSDSFKILIWNKMVEQGVTAKNLAGALGIMHAQADRLLQIGTRTGIDLIERAIGALQCNVVILFKENK